jgi:hypothetical protein
VPVAPAEASADASASSNGGVARAEAAAEARAGSGKKLLGEGGKLGPLLFYRCTKLVRPLRSFFVLVSTVVPAGYYLKAPGVAAPCPKGEWKASTNARALLHPRFMLAPWNWYSAWAVLLTFSRRSFCNGLRMSG